LRDACVAAPVDRAQLAERARANAPKAGQEKLPFERTARFLRGRIVDRLRDLVPGEALAIDALQQDLARVVPADRLHEIPGIVDALERDAIVMRIAECVRLR
jgi:hypothetical protein